MPNTTAAAGKRYLLEKVEIILSSKYTGCWNYILPHGYILETPGKPHNLPGVYFVFLYCFLEEGVWPSCFRAVME